MIDSILKKVSWIESIQRTRTHSTIPSSKFSMSLCLLALLLSNLSIAYGAPQVNEREFSSLAGEASVNRSTAAQTPSGQSKKQEINLLDLLIRGGGFMIPIGIVSLVVVTFMIDRGIGIRSGKIFPRQFKKSLNHFGKQLEVDPRQLYQSCLEHPSAASNVVRSMVIQTGRPASELYKAVEDTLQREADKAYSHVKWLNLSAGVAPLLGLLGTVWGLIQAFHDTTKLTAGQNRADFLAGGIYEALVTTLAGLIVAIPAAIASHYFESKISKLSASIEESVKELIPRLEKFEGKTRFEIIGRELSPRETSTSLPNLLQPIANSAARTVRT